MNFLLLLFCFRYLGTMDEDTEYLKLPIEDQFVHKLWKARVHGYEAALKVSLVNFPSVFGI